MVSKIFSLLLITTIFLYVQCYPWSSEEQQADARALEEIRRLRRSVDDLPGLPENVRQRLIQCSSRMEENARTVFWGRVKNWWTDLLEMLKKAGEKVGRFFKDIFTPKGERNSASMTTTPMSTATTTANYEKAINDLCREREKVSTTFQQTIATVTTPLTVTSKPLSTLATIESVTNESVADGTEREIQATVKSVISYDITKNDIPLVND